MRELNTILKELLLAIDQYFLGEECLPVEIYDHYEEARAAIGYQIVVASLTAFDGLDGRYQLLQDAIDGQAWPPNEWVDTGGVPDEL